jgi:hypothetical protein
MVSTLVNHFLLVEQGKVQLLLEKPCYFSEKKMSQKSGIRFGISRFIAQNKNQDDPTAPSPLRSQKWNIFTKKKGLQNLIYLKMCIVRFIKNK